MSQTWMEDLESEEYESNGEADYGDAGDDARSDARRARQQRIMLERRRTMLERQQREGGLQRKSGLPRGPVPPPGAARATGPSPSQTIRAIRHLDLETKVELDSLRRQLEESNRRASRGTWTAVAGIATAEIINQFEVLGKHPNVSAAILAAPLLLLSPEKKGSGIERWITDPRVIGGAAVIGIVVANKLTSASTGPPSVRSISIAAPTPLTSKAAATTPVNAIATAVDRNGNPLPVPATGFTWNSSSKDLTFVSASGAQATFTLAENVSNIEVVQITAQAGGATGTLNVTVNPPS
jgi:hypothetical protein